MRVRDATDADADACAAIYAPYVRDTVATFELEPPTATVMAERIASAQRHHAWLVAVDDEDETVGYAYGGPYRPRPAYRWTAEVTVYLAGDRRGRGTGRALYDALVGRLRDRGYRSLIGTIAVPNPASEGLHRTVGFTPAGRLARVGWKHGAWRDVELWQLALGSADDPPAEPR